MTETKIGMLLIQGQWNSIETFKMIPLTKDCPYNECIFDPITKALAIVSKEKKAGYHMIPKIDDQGDLIPAKKTRANGGKFQEQRVTIDTYYEYYINTKQDIGFFLDTFVVNIESLSLAESILEKAFLEVPEETAA